MSPSSAPLSNLAFLLQCCSTAAFAFLPKPPSYRFVRCLSSVSRFAARYNRPQDSSTLLKMQQRWSTIKLLCEPLAQILKHPSILQAFHASSSLQVAMLEGTSSDKRNSRSTFKEQTLSRPCWNLYQILIKPLLQPRYYILSLLKAGGYSDWI
ncbi:hypothetical protein R3P38DRAFT_3286765 [Favolaschia claudopus]|uniref:Uncharacterized protein n=1 Tax=Favolaschia claudopus TaxID=2862362 RepID=A0AAW0A1N0_9AGAR